MLRRPTKRNVRIISIVSTVKLTRFEAKIKFKEILLNNLLNRFYVINATHEMLKLNIKYTTLTPSIIKFSIYDAHDDHKMRMWLPYSQSVSTTID
jgi:hypothetical protein